MTVQNESGTTPAGKTKSAGWQIGARKTFDLALNAAWKLICSAEGQACWLGGSHTISIAPETQYQFDDGTHGTVRVVKHNSHLRMGWHPQNWPRSSTIQIRVLPAGSRTTIAFHQEHLPNEQARLQRKEFYKTAFRRLDDIISG
jgi:activator of HSP90 ATPase